MADSSTYTIKIAGGVEMGLLSSLDALKEKILGGNSAFAGMAKAATAITAAVMGAQALRHLMTDAINAADEMGKLSEEIGMTTEALSGLKLAANLSDVGEQFRAGMLKFSGAIADSSTQGSKAAQVFQAMGVETRGLNGQLRPTKQILNDVADKFASYEAGANKSALAMELFGTKNARFINLLNEGSAGLRRWNDEASKRGSIVTKEDAERAQAFNDAFTNLKDVVSGAAKTIALELVPTVTEFVTESIKALTSTGDWKNTLQELGAIARQTALSLGITTQAVAELIDVTVTAAGAMTKLHNTGVFRNAINSILGTIPGVGIIPSILWRGKDTESMGSAMESIFGKLDGLAKRSAERWDKAGDRLRALIGIADDLGKKPGDTGAKDAEGGKVAAPSIAPQTDLWEQFYDMERDAAKEELTTYRDQLEARQQLFNLERVKAQSDFSLTDLEKRDKELALLKNEADYLDEIIRKMQQRRELISEPAAKESFDQAIGQAQQQRAGVEMRRYQAQSTPDPRSFAQAGVEAMTKLRQMTMTVGQTMGELASKMRSAFSNLGDGIADIILKGQTMGQVWGNAGAQIFRTITQMVSEYVAAKLAMMAVDAVASSKSQKESAKSFAASMPAGLSKAGEEGSWVGVLVYLGVFAAAMAAMTALASAVTGGFKEGGYTGNMSPDEMAGVVHGREYVFDADSTSRIGVANLERIRQGSYAPTAASGSSSGRSSGNQSQPVNVKIAAINGRQDMRDFMASEGHKIVWDQSAKRGNKFKT